MPFHDFRSRSWEILNFSTQQCRKQPEEKACQADADLLWWSPSNSTSGGHHSISASA